MPGHEPIRLSVADFERTLRLAADVRIAELELALAMERAKRRLQMAKDAHAAHMAVLGKRYRGFKPEDAHYTIDESTRTLRPTAPGAEP